MKLVKIAGLLLALLPLVAWGPEGHEVVAHIAARGLTPHARAAVAKLLGGEAETMMVLNASWADEVRSDRPDTADWHYVNIELDAPGYDGSRDCPQAACVVAQIARDEAMLSSRAPASAKAEALKFLIHFVADIHQPLHVADDHDRGGNTRQLTYRGRRVSLHHVWDDDVVAALGRDPTAIAFDIWAGLTPQQKQSLGSGTPESWANDSFAVARGIYDQLGARDTLPSDYPQRERNITRLQLARAGLRLAAALNNRLR